VKIAAALCTLLFASAVQAAQAHVAPLGPTSVTPVEVHYVSPCLARGHSVTRDGSLIRVTALDPQCVQVLPIPFVDEVQLPELLPPGEYSVEVRLEGSAEVVAGTEFVVRNGGPQPFEVHPFAVSEGVPVRMTGVTCDEADCSDITVRAGGEPVESLTVDGDGAIWFTLPQLDQGLADVTVEKSDFISISPTALYVSHHPEEELDVYERILFPVLFDADGAFGSKWRSEATVSNPRPWYVWNYTTFGPEPCIEGDCGRTIPPKDFVKHGGGYPRGKLLWVPRPEAPDLALALRVRDVSRQAEGFGTQVPVVREKDMVHGSLIQLLDVPLDPRYRVKVRIYMIDPVLAPFLGGAVTIPRGDTRLDLPFTLTRQDARNEPYYAEVDLPQGAVGERVRVEIRLPLDAIGWAFASVTNNETQQVTIVAPY
jgi:hypothetical protein